MGPCNDHDNIDGDARIGTIKFIGLYFCFVFYFCTANINMFHKIILQL